MEMRDDERDEHDWEINLRILGVDGEWQRNAQLTRFREASLGKFACNDPFRGNQLGIWAYTLRAFSVYKNSTTCL